MRVHIATDHAAFDLKEYLVEQLTEHGYEVVDHGATSYDADDDYPPDTVIPCAEAVAAGGELGIVLGGSGNGEQIAANKVKGCRAALAYNVELARLGRQHNDATSSAWVGGCRLSTRLADREGVPGDPRSAARSDTYAGWRNWRTTRRPAPWSRPAAAPAQACRRAAGSFSRGHPRFNEISTAAASSAVTCSGVRLLGNHPAGGATIASVPAISVVSQDRRGQGIHPVEGLVRRGRPAPVAGLGNLGPQFLRIGDRGRRTPLVGEPGPPGLLSGIGEGERHLAWAEELYAKFVPGGKLTPRVELLLRVSVTTMPESVTWENTMVLPTCSLSVAITGAAMVTTGGERCPMVRPIRISRQPRP